MPRIARVVIPEYPHHVVQRGSRRQRTFFSDEDYQRYMILIGEAIDKAQASIWAYCLMPNHVHMVVVPQRRDSLAKLFSTAHLKYTRHINCREGWQGHLWQERFHSAVMDEKHLIATVRYIELNPVRANLVSSAEEWPWSSVHAHLNNRKDFLVDVEPMRSRISDWRDYLTLESQQVTMEDIREHCMSGRPAGDQAFTEHIEKMTGRILCKRKPGRKAKMTTGCASHAEV